MKILLANPRGFCAGVDRAIDIVERALHLFGSPIYVRHEVVHNRFVVNDLKNKGAIFVEELDEVPTGATVIFSAHGVSQAVQKEAQARGLNVFDATCPLVTKVHMEVKRYRERGIEVVLIGHQGHPEVEGTMGQVDTQGDAQEQASGMYLIENSQDVQSLQVQNEHSLAYVTQTTLSVDDTQKVIDALKVRYPNIQGPRKDDICYATQNRQDAVRALSRDADVVIVVGSNNSSNSSRLRELAENIGVPSYLVDQPEQIQRAWFDKVDVVGVTAGASAPEELVKQVIDQIKSWGGTVVNEANGPVENVSFSLPIELRHS